MQHHSRCLLHAIHQLFPTPEITGHHGEDPISYKKLVLEKEGVWEARKEILGWIFDGINRTLELPEKKVKTLRDTLTSILRVGFCDTSDFHSIVGKLHHASFGIPAGKSLMAPLYRCLNAAQQQEKPTVQFHKGSEQEAALKDFRALFTVMSTRPTHCKELIPGMPAYVGNVDSCKWGVGGTWRSGTRKLFPFVWRVKWPPEIVKLFEMGLLTINDLECAGLLIANIILEYVVDVKHAHVGTWCDNSSTVWWVLKMTSKTSIVGQQLIRAMALRQLANQSSPLVPMSIEGKVNGLGDVPSRSFKATGEAGNYDWDDVTFLTNFNKMFPLT